MKKIKLGDKVEHTITGVKGIAVAITEYISGCSRITIQQRVNKDGKLPDSLSFDEPEIKVLQSKKQKRETITGGWKPNINRMQIKSNLY